MLGCCWGAVGALLAPCSEKPFKKGPTQLPARVPIGSLPPSHAEDRFFRPPFEAVTGVFTLWEESTVRCARLTESSPVHVTLPSGVTLSDSPENRVRARKLWTEQNSSPIKVENELEAEEQRVRVQEEHLRAQREEFERALENEQEQRAQEQEQYEHDQRALEQQHDSQRAQERAHEQERERARRQEIDNLNLRLHYEQQLGEVWDRIRQEMEENEHGSALHNGTTDGHARAQRDRTRLQAFEKGRVGPLDIVSTAPVTCITSKGLTL